MDIVLNTVFNNPNLPKINIPGFYDNFEGNASQSSLGHTSREHREWEYPEGEGWWRTSRGTASGYQKPGSRTAVVEGYASDGLLRATIASPSTTDHRAGLCLRLRDPQNYLYVSPSGGSTSWNLYDYTNGTATLLHQVDGATPTARDIIEVQFIGSNIALLINGTILMNVESSAHVNGTKHGLFNWSTTQASANAEWDDIHFIAA